MMLEITKIQEGKISENVIDLLVEKIKELNFGQAEILKLAACVGDSFRSDIFLTISSKDYDQIISELTVISNEGFLIITPFPKYADSNSA